MIVPNKGYHRKYAFGGTGILETAGRLLKNFVTSQAGKDLTRHLLDSATNITKKTASDIGSRLIKKALTPKSKSIISKHTRALTKNDAIKINNLVKKLNSGSGIKKI